MDDFRCVDYKLENIEKYKQRITSPAIKNTRFSCVRCVGVNLISFLPGGGDT